MPGEVETVRTFGQQDGWLFGVLSDSSPVSSDHSVTDGPKETAAASRVLRAREGDGSQKECS